MIVFIDIEVNADGNIIDIGAVKKNGEFHSKSTDELSRFLRGAKYICGHNILRHDLKYIEQEVKDSGITHFIDTLYLSPLLFPKKPYHNLVKDDKLNTDEINNPLNDAKKARDLFYDEESKFKDLDEYMQSIYYELLRGHKEFKDFFFIVDYKKITDYETNASDIETLIRSVFAGKICENAAIDKLIKKYPVELAYALAQINVIKYNSVTPPWVLKNYPQVENILHFLRSKKCIKPCAYCSESLDETKALKKFFHYNEFRNYEAIPLQKNAVCAAIEDKSILTIFPTGGGKSITFQLPALMAGENEKGLTVVISPLQSLMKDQTDNLEKQHNITEAVTINSSLDPLERAKSFERVEDGSASILYISPESLRSKSIEILLLKRNIVRFVIDEAHCFSAWGQDFRVDYLYIGDFIQALQKKKNMQSNIPVSCFTATAKQKVIADIKDYFKEKLSAELEVFRAGAGRTNLKYHIFSEEDKEEKYLKLRQLITDNDCPTIIYVSRTRRTEELAARLTEDGYPAKPYHGQMDKQIRIANQDEFMAGKVSIIVATTAFGMGVDKRDVGMVIHFDISDSLENYVQEAGRAGRDENINADCYVLFNDEDLNKHFILLNQTKVSQKEIQQVWKAIKEMTKSQAGISLSALEIAKKSGWDDSVADMETRIKTVINALEQSDFVKRGQNMPRIFADSILVKNMEDARTRIDNSARFDDASRAMAISIMSNLISARRKSLGSKETGETRIDYISDILGIVKEDIIRVIGLLREEKILSDAKDLTAYIKKKENTNRSKNILSINMKVEDFLTENLDENEKTYNIKEMNEKLQEIHPETNINILNEIINYWTIKRIVKRTHEYSKNYVTLKPYFAMDEIKLKSGKRIRIAGTIIEQLYAIASEESDSKNSDDIVVGFSVLELKEHFEQNLFGEKADIDEIEDALYYLLKIGALKIEGGFLVIYNAMRIERIEPDSKAQYKKEHYKQLEGYYLNKMQQIHIVGEYANRMINDYSSAMEFVDDYFVMNYDLFLKKYFKGRREEITQNITPKKFKQLFGELSASQSEIIKDKESPCVVVAAGPGSGKTKLLAHKLASLYIMEDVKHEQMLMLTFSRAAATEFKKRLMTLIDNAANYIQIMTFHSYCFDLLGKIGDLEKSDTIIAQTVDKINCGEVDLTRLTKTVLVIDEAQDMSEAEFSLIKVLKDKNENLRIIAVGDDDQNIYQFRGSSPKHLEMLLNEPQAKKYELVDNYRSNANLVDFANQFSNQISHRLKRTPIQAINNNNGKITVCKMSSDNITIPVVNAVIKEKPLGTTCIVTRTNDEALNIVGLLIENNIPAKQIQTNNDFNLYDLAELRDFILDIESENDSYSISDEVWQSAKQKLRKNYYNSKNLPGAMNLIKDFEEINNKIKYKSDFKQFVRESRLEDFLTMEDVILVSTIHQTKGREFDNVFLAFSSFYTLNDAVKRQIYVALTRAKKNLYIYYCGDYFDKINTANMQRFTDTNIYDAPKKIAIQLSHRDVVLSYFFYRQRELNLLQSGENLDVRDTACYYKNTQVLKFSNKFCEKISELQTKGYIPIEASVRHIVYWQNKDKEKDNEKEIKIILPDVQFVKAAEG